MTQISRSALVRRSAAHMFDLVNEVEAYPKRFTWCEGAEVLERSEVMMLARLNLKMGGMRTAFSTRNRMQPGRRIELRLAEGPFKSLEGSWDFIALADEVCKVELQMNFETAGLLMGSALAMGFQSLMDRLVDDFVREATRE
ncbi:MAG: Ribosome association toxin RatA [Alphaproteobacteria bacterium ADurb.BinA280]|jgi:ribosome-associated toxin RatA of RatAB toxin-antitoxin module|nr:type II toxin-antitoxin system RatA family toxin [Xanthomonadales bacterium]MCC6505723.1 type II toxin-antitoxin system RatA family toxin [Aquimonas sp.]OPZ11655.1 MAG: Ribosome association toxin RatA [Alphaproteobacteria bacterium ADurb.BinA280]